MPTEYVPRWIASAAAPESLGKVTDKAAKTGFGGFVSDLDKALNATVAEQWISASEVLLELQLEIVRASTVAAEAFDRTYYDELWRRWYAVQEDEESA
jgi:hypothetical protein